MTVHKEYFISLHKEDLSAVGSSTHKFVSG